MKLLVSKTSPYVRKTRIVLREKALTERVEEVFVSTTPLDTDDQLKLHNPLGKIPCLILDDGLSVVDSRVICQYLDEEGMGEVLHPSGNIRHAALIALGDGMLDSAVSMAYEKKIRPMEFVFEPWIEAQWQKIERSLKYIEEYNMDLLERFNMAVIGVVCALEYLDFRHDDRQWRLVAPELGRWYESVKDRESFLLTRPEE